MTQDAPCRECDTMVDADGYCACDSPNNVRRSTSSGVWPTGPAVLLGMQHGDLAILRSTYGDGVLMLYSWLAAGVPTDVLVRTFDRIPVAEGR